MSSRVLSVASVLTLAACSGELSPGSRIEDPRVLGARIEVVGNEASATPAPGETANVRFFVATPPWESADASWAFVPCVKQSGSTPLCAGPLLIDQLATGEGTPDLTVRIPNAGDLLGQQTMLLSGIVCFGGTPTLDASGSQLPGCSDSTTKAQVVTLDFEVTLDAVRNLNPSMQATVLTLDGDTWMSAGEAAPATGCEGVAGTSTLPRIVAASTEHELRMDVATVARDTYTRTVPGEPPIIEEAREQLLFSHFASGGSMQRQFSVLERTAEAPEGGFLIKWDAPKDVEDGGSRVDFHFVVRDGRGGSDWITRSACVVAATQ